MIALFAHTSWLFYLIFFTHRDFIIYIYVQYFSMYIYVHISTSGV